MSNWPSRVVLFDSRLRENFRPLCLTRPAFDFLFGAQSICERLEVALGVSITDAVIPDHLEEIAKGNHPKLELNNELSEPCIAINSFVSPSMDLKKEIERLGSNTVVVDSEGIPVLARLEKMKIDPRSLEPNALGAKKERLETRGVLIKHPWELVSRNAEAITIDYNLRREEKVDSTTSFETKGDRIAISDSAEVDRFVTLDSREGPVIIGDNAKVESFTHIKGPAYIGNESEIKSARIKAGTSIGKRCKIGGEVEESIFFEYSNKNHDGFIGHSLVGSWANLGALTTNSDLKNTYGHMRSSLGERPFDTGMEKVGIFLGDMCKSSIGTLVFGGKRIGVSSHLFGTVHEDVPSFTIYSKELRQSKELDLSSAIETQRRMMRRRGLELSDAYMKMMQSLFKMTARERLSSHVPKGKFRFA